MRTQIAIMTAPSVVPRRQPMMNEYMARSSLLVSFTLNLLFRYPDAEACLNSGRMESPILPRPNNAGASSFWVLNRDKDPFSSNPGSYRQDCDFLFTSVQADFGFGSITEQEPRSMEFIFETAPYAHQRAELQRSCFAEYWAYFWEQGTGKSKLFIDRCANMWAADKIAGALLLSMNGPHADFVREGVTEHWPKGMQIVARSYRSGMGKRAKAEFEQVMQPGNGFRLMTINYEAARTKPGMDACLRFIRSCSGRVLIGADESDLIKSPSAAQTRAAINLARKCSHRVIMTGTEVTQGPLDLYAQTQFLLPGALGCPNFITFKNHYAEWRERIIQSGPGPARRFPELVRYKNLEELRARLAKFSSTLKKRDCLDLPEKVYVQRSVILGEEQRRHYDLVRERVLAECDAGEITTDHALTKILRLAQITGGFLPLDGQEPRPIGNAKWSVMLQDIEAVPEDDGIIVWARFVPELRFISEALAQRWTVARYWGEIDPETRALEAEEFKAGRRRIMVAQQQAGGRGHTWLRGTHVFYFSNDYSWARRAQSEDRPHRIGQTQTVTYYDYAAEDTVDRKIIAALKFKQNLAEFFKDRNSIKEFLS